MLIANPLPSILNQVPVVFTVTAQILEPNSLIQLQSQHGNEIKDTDSQTQGIQMSLVWQQSFEGHLTI